MTKTNMASNLPRFLSTGPLRGILSPLKQNKSVQIISKRTNTFTPTGALLPEPEVTKFGTVKVIAVSFPFLYFGQWLGKSVAAWLEETELFVPDDDDD